MANDQKILIQIATDKLLLEQDLLKLASEAAYAAELIEKKYKFEEESEAIHVYNDGLNEEYVTSDGYWNARYLNNRYSQKCSPEEIYKLYRDAYFFEHNYFNDEHHIKQARIAANFREFVKHTRLLR